VLQVITEALVKARRRQEDKDLASSDPENVLRTDPAVAFLRAQLAFREQPREAAIGGAGFRIADHLRSVGWNKARADQQAQPGLFCGDMCPHGAGQRVAIGDADGDMAKALGDRNEFLCMGGAAQEGEVGCNGEFGISAHANSPCTYHSGAPPRPSP
jgi:hypothetical protein